MPENRSREDRGEPGGERVAETIIWDEETSDISLVRVLSVLLRHRRKLVLLPLAVAVVAIAVGFLLPQSWTTSAAFLPQSDQVQSPRLSSLAAQFGVSLPTGASGQSPQFYADLMQSEALLKEVVGSTYSYARGGSESDTVATDLVALYDVHAETRAASVVEAVERFRDDLSVSTRSETGLVRFSVQMPAPDLSQQVARRLVELVNEFNLQTRQTRASEERRFLEERLESAREDLLAAEDSLERFLENNRGYESSPTLRFAQQRLQRRVQLEQQVYTSLAQSYEEAKISEVRNTPVITVVEPPERPAKPDRRNLLMKAVFGGFLGLFGGLFWGFGKEFTRTAREREPNDYDELRSLWDATRADLRSFTRWIRRRMPGLKASSPARERHRS